MCSFRMHFEMMLNILVSISLTVRSLVFSLILFPCVFCFYRYILFICTLFFPIFKNLKSLYIFSTCAPHTISDEGFWQFMDSSLNHRTVLLLSLFKMSSGSEKCFWFTYGFFLASHFSLFPWTQRFLQILWLFWNNFVLRKIIQKLFHNLYTVFEDQWWNSAHFGFWQTVAYLRCSFCTRSCYWNVGSWPS